MENLNNCLASFKNDDKLDGMFVKAYIGFINTEI